MDQVKIGKFIAECRKQNNLTQMQLAEKLNITDRAVSKWETGKAMPDSSIMLQLCEILKISVNDLLCGERIIMDNHNKETEKIIVEMVKQKEEADKRLLYIEILVGVLCMIVFFALVIVASLVNMEEWLRILLILIGFTPLLIACPFMLKIEQTAGYYECQKCGNRYIPTYSSVFFAPHINRTRYMKCPECHKKSWQKKVLSKE
ncbi:MAG: helix-turn-helix transcriptional regulator [Ruminococcaceae bacterium]|nr:helix-turn-helix transcriptional regulator [Oscillospiraceae bacterium]